MINKQSPFKKALLYLLILLLLVLFLFPIYWMFIGSFKDNSVLMRLPPQFYPTFSTFKSYEAIFSNAKYMKYILNSMIVAALTVGIDLLFSIFGGYSLSRFRYPGRKAIMTVTLSAQVFPTVVIIISLYEFFSKFKLMNTYYGLSLADVAMSLPLSVWMLKSFCDGVPRSLDEAAKVDGCGRFMTMVRIVIPLLKPGMLAVGIYAFLMSWDDYMLGLVIMTKTPLKTLPVGIQGLSGQYTTSWGPIGAALVVATFPTLFIYIFLSKKIQESFIAGAVKG